MPDQPTNVTTDPMMTMIPTADASTQLTTTPSKPKGWRFWYTVGIVIFAAVMNLPYHPTEFVYFIIFGWLIYYIPVWLIVLGVRAFRRQYLHYRYGK